MGAGSDRPVGMTGARFGRVERRPTPAEPVDEGLTSTPLPEPPAYEDLAPQVGMTGARFARPTRRHRKVRQSGRQTAPPSTDPWDTSPDVTGAAAPHSTPEEFAGPVAAEPEPLDEEVDDLDRSVRVRPYVLTGGRTRSELPLEALITTTHGTPTRHLADAHRAVVQLCQVSQSVAEVAARLRVPIGVARVLVDDLAGSRAVTVHRGTGGGAHPPDMALMERVLLGLQRL